MDYVAARLNMIDSQVRTNSIRNPGLSTALAEVPRELFLPKAMRSYAYLDDNLDVGGRWLIEPLVLARLLEAAGIRPGDMVLNVGDATGYATAVIARMAAFVVALDCDGDWVQKAGATLAELGINNVDFVHGPLPRGHAARAPYDAIVFCGSVDTVPAEILAQLAEGGRLVAVVGTASGQGRAVLVVRAGDGFGRREVFDASLPALPGMAAKPSFVF